MVLLGVFSLSDLSRATDLVKHTDDVRVSLGGLLSTLVDAETGVRGYVIAGDPQFLEPYERALSTWQAQFDQVRALTADNADQHQRLNRLLLFVGERLSNLRSLRDAGKGGAQLLPAIRDGKRSMDEVRAVVAEMDREERRLAEIRQGEVIRRWRWTMTFFVGSALAFLLVVGAALVQRRDADQKRHRAEEVTRARELFSVVLQGVDIGITVQDPGGRLVYANEAAAKLIGYDSPDALLAAPMTEVVGRFEMFNFDGTPFPAEQMPGRAALEGRSSEEIPLRFRVRGTREERWSLVRSVPAKDLSGKRVLYAINFFREITDEIREKHQRTFLLRAADELGSSLDYEKMLATVAKLAVPVLADWCAIDLVEGDRTRRVAIAHVDPAKLTFVEELERRYPSDPNAKTGVHEILRTGKPEFIPAIPHELLRAAAVDEEHLRLIDQLHLSSYIGVPLTVHGKTIGVLTIAMAESGRNHTEKDLELAQQLAGRAALAIDNARLLRQVEQAHAVATSQRDLSEERFRLMVESVTDYAIITLDRDGKVTTWNRGAERINGYRGQEIIGQHFSRFYPEEYVRAGECDRELQTAVREGRLEIEGEHVRKDGARYLANVVITPVTDASGQLVGFAKITRDLTERKRAEEDLAAEVNRRSEAEAESQFAQTFIGILGHDLRNPLNAIMMAASLMKRKGNVGDAKTIDRILSSTQRMTNMVAQLLDLTRSRLAGGIRVEKRPTDLGAVITGIIDELRLVYPSRDIRFDSPTGGSGSWDKDRLAQVVSNLIGNALEHGDPSKPVTVRVSARKDATVLTVHSFGPPIPSELIPVLFDPYRQSAVRSERSKGLGLGLFITQQIVAAHGGSIECRSTDAEGTTFTITLPTLVS